MVEWFPKSKSLSCAITPTSLIPSWCFSFSDSLASLICRNKNTFNADTGLPHSKKVLSLDPSLGPLNVRFACLPHVCVCFLWMLYFPDTGILIWSLGTTWWLPSAPQSWVQCNAEIQFHSTLRICYQFNKYLLKCVIDSVCCSVVWIVFCLFAMQYILFSIILHVGLIPHFKTDRQIQMNLSCDEGTWNKINVFWMQPV